MKISYINDLNRSRSIFAYNHIKKVLEAIEDTCNEIKKLEKESDNTDKFLSQINDLKDKKLDKEKYKSHLTKFPMLIKNNGIFAAMSFAKGKDKEYKQIYKDIVEWLKKLDLLQKDFVEEIEDIDFKLITIETIEVCIWFKRLASTMIEKG